MKDDTQINLRNSIERLIDRATESLEIRIRILNIERMEKTLRVDALEESLRERSTFVEGVELACEQLREQNKQLKGILQTTEKDVEHFRQQALARCAEIDTLRAALLQKDDEAKALRGAIEELNKQFDHYENEANTSKVRYSPALREALERQDRLDTFAAAALCSIATTNAASEYKPDCIVAWKYAEAMEAERDKRLAQTNPVKA